MINKKGSVSDILFGVVVIFGIAVAAIAGTYMNDAFNDVVQNESWVSDDAKQPIDDYATRIPQNFDAGIVFAFAALHLGIISASVLLRSHPIVFPALFLFLLVIVMLSGYISNSYEDVISTEDMASQSEEFPMVTYVLENFLVLNLVLGFLDIIIFLGFGALLSGGGI